MKEWDKKFDVLAVYNSEKVRGLLHTKEWEEKMRELQKEYMKWVQS